MKKNKIIMITFILTLFFTLTLALMGARTKSGEVAINPYALTGVNTTDFPVINFTAQAVTMTTITQIRGLPTKIPTIYPGMPLPTGYTYAGYTFVGNYVYKVVGPIGGVIKVTGINYWVSSFSSCSEITLTDQYGTVGPVGTAKTCLKILDFDPNTTGGTGPGNVSQYTLTSDTTQNYLGMGYIEIEIWADYLKMAASTMKGKVTGSASITVTYMN